MKYCVNYEIYHQECGVDEAGRGYLAGPVCIAAVMLPKDLETPEGITIRDSKKMSEKKREASAEWIKNNATSWATEFIEVEDIDRLNILNATLWGMRKVVSKLDPKPDFIAIDGPHYQSNTPDIPHGCYSSGDDLYRNIAAASILAKTTRDKYMIELHDSFPVYNWKKNKAYGTLEHREAIKQHGLTIHHRKSFKCV